MNDIKLHSYDPKLRKAVYKGDTPLATGRGISFDLIALLPHPQAVDPTFSLRVDFGDPVVADTFDAARKRLALWLRNAAEALEGDMVSAIPLQIDRTTTDQVYRPATGEYPKVGDKVISDEEELVIERMAARDQVKLAYPDGGSAKFALIEDLTWRETHWEHVY